jgi:peptidoglycan-associated lipoprotein
MLLALSTAVIVGCAADQTKESAESTLNGGNTAGIGADGNLSGTELDGGRSIKSEVVYDPDDKMSPAFGKEFDDPSTFLSKRVIYFQYDTTDVSAEYQPIVLAHANYLARNPNISVLLEGHTDERGSREYNLALGERRAQSVRQLMQLTALPNQLEVVSYGEERPTTMGHDESAWQLNRRVEIVYRRK